MRFFALTDAVYEAARTGLDTTLGFPDALTISCMPVAADALHDASGRVLVALAPDLASGPDVAPLLASLLTNGQAVEIDEATYRAAMPVAVLPG
jgi:hypothetical protein